LSGYKGWVHAGGYSGFNGVFCHDKASEMACMAHIRRKFVDVQQSQGSAIVEEAIRYALDRLPKARPYLENGVLELDNNSVERAMKPVAIGRKIGHSPVRKAAAKPWRSPTP